MSSYKSIYRERMAIGDLRQRADALRMLMADCRICPRHCRAARLENGLGTCETGADAVVYSAAPHFGEEYPLSGTRGSGTIFFSSCNLRCVYCQNYEISHHRLGNPVTSYQLAALMVKLQEDGCHNINLVTPTHVTWQIVSALIIAVENGLRIPLVYNCGGYDSLETLRLLDGIIDIFMPDMKYARDDASLRYSGVPDYWTVARSAVLQMQKSVGVLEIDEQGIARRGLLVRHLVLPQCIADSRAVIAFIAREISPDTYVNIMNQYRPAYRASSFPPLDRCVSREEVGEVVRFARTLGLHRGFS